MAAQVRIEQLGDRAVRDAAGAHALLAACDCILIVPGMDSEMHDLSLQAIAEAPTAAGVASRTGSGCGIAARFAAIG
jgi:hypothetical protein